MKIILIFFLSFSITINYNLTYEEFLKSTPQKFGLITVTYNPDKNYTFFRKHLEKYAQMECQPMEQIVIVWNNIQKPQEAGFTQKANWRRPVYFQLTPHNSMDYRYLLPPKSKSKVFFSIDDDIFTTCQELKKSFQVWQNHSVGDIAPLMGYGQRSFDFFAKKSSFTYSDQLEAGKYFILTLIGEAWVPRHYFELYNAEKSWEVKQMRKFVQKNNNCDDIALNYMVNYFYPEFVAMHLKGDVANKSPKHGRQSTEKRHYQLRNQCVQLFTNILGYNPMRIISKKWEQNSQERFVNPFNKKIIYEKRKMYEEMFVTGKYKSQNAQNIIFTSDTGLDDQKTFQQRQTIWSQRQKQLRQQIIAKAEQNRMLQLRLSGKNPSKVTSSVSSDKDKNQIQNHLSSSEQLPQYAVKGRQVSEYVIYMKLFCIVAFAIGFLMILQRLTTKKDKSYENVPSN